jgi:adenine-specific DNA-methyltransferase
MNQSIQGASVRKIADRQHNKLLEERATHRRTQTAPPSLLQPFDEETRRQIDTRHRELEPLLRERIGEPYFSQPGFSLYKGDCVELLGNLVESDLHLELTITSPPYNIGKEYEQLMPVEDYIEWCSKWMGLIHRITSKHGAFWLNLGYLEVPQKGLSVPIPYLLWDRSPFYFLQEIVWNYGAGVSSKRGLSPRNEKWLFYSKDAENYTFNLDDIRDPNVKYPNQKKNGKYRCNPSGKNPSDVWEFPKVTTGKDRSSQERTGHPAQFPLAIIERIIKASSNPVDMVLDPFAGSCSTGIAAFGLGRIFIGFETREDYCKLAVARLKRFMDERRRAEEQVPLF